MKRRGFLGALFGTPIVAIAATKNRASEDKFAGLPDLKPEAVPARIGDNTVWTMCTVATYEGMRPTHVWQVDAFENQITK